MILTEPEYFQLTNDNRRMLNHEAADVLGLPLDAEAVEYVVSGAIQHVWCSVFRKGRHIDNLLGYLRISVRRGSIDYLRLAPEEVALEDLLPQVFAGDDPLETLNLHYDPPLALISDVQAAMKQLTVRQQRIVWGMVVEGLTLKEVGQEVGLPHPERVRRQLVMALADLRRALWAYDVRRPPRRGA